MRRALLGGLTAVALLATAACGSSDPSNFVDTAPDVPIGVYFTVQRTVTDKADLTRRFTTATRKSLQYTQDHPDETPQALLTYTKITPDIAHRITLPSYPQEINQAAVTTLVGKMRSDGLLTKDVNLAEVQRGTGPAVSANAVSASRRCWSSGECRRSRRASSRSLAGPSRPSWTRQKSNVS